MSTNENDERLSILEKRVEQHDLWMRGDGQVMGVIPNVRTLIESSSRTETAIREARAEIKDVRDTMLTGKAWIAGAIAAATLFGGLVVWLIEKFVFRHP